MSELISRQAVLDAIRGLYIAQPKINNDYAYDMALDKADDAIRVLPSAEPEIVMCKDCKYAHMTYNGECKYCDIWFPDEKTYMSGDYYCGSAERREE